MILLSFCSSCVTVVVAVNMLHESMRQKMVMSLLVTERKNGIHVFVVLSYFVYLRLLVLYSADMFEFGLLCFMLTFVCLLSVSFVRLSMFTAS